MSPVFSDRDPSVSPFVRDRDLSLSVFGLAAGFSTGYLSDPRTPYGA